MTDEGHSVILSERRQNMTTVQTTDGQIPPYPNTSDCLTLVFLSPR